MADPNELNPNLKVKDLIIAFEHQREDQDPIYYEEDLPNKRKLRTSKSFIGGLPYKLFRESKSEFHNIFDIENKLVDIETQINSYKIYDKEIHVAFQEQLFYILASIVDIDAQGDQNTFEKKKHLIKNIQNLARHLNLKLPKNHHSVKVGTIIKQGESIIDKQGDKQKESTTGNQINDFNDSKKTINSNAPIELEKQEIDPSEVNVNEGFILPSVKKLKQLFSFKKTNEELAKSNVTEISRSKSWLWKSKDNATKQIVTEAPVSNQNKENVTTTVKENKNDTEENFAKPEVEIVEKSTQNQQQTNESISVKKLRKLFEQDKPEDSQGLRMVFNTQPIIANATGIAFTAMHLGAFRLKRSLSGQYMNQVGLIRKESLSSRSIGDLTSFNEKDPLIINDLGNIENDINDNEEETMPSLDYNGGLPKHEEETMPSLDYNSGLHENKEETKPFLDYNGGFHENKEETKPSLDQNDGLHQNEEKTMPSLDYNGELHKNEEKTNSSLDYNSESHDNKEEIKPTFDYNGGLHENNETKPSSDYNSGLHENEVKTKPSLDYDGGLIFPELTHLQIDQKVILPIKTNEITDSSKLTTELSPPKEDDSKTPVIDKEDEHKQSYNSENDHDKAELEKNRHFTDDKEKPELTTEITVTEKENIEDETNYSTKHVTDDHEKNKLTTEFLSPKEDDPKTTVIGKEDTEDKHVKVEFEINQHVTNHDKKNEELNTKLSSPKKEDSKTTTIGKEDIEDQNSQHKHVKVECEVNKHVTDDDNKNDELTTKLSSPKTEDPKITIIIGKEDKEDQNDQHKHVKVEFENRYVTYDDKKNSESAAAHKETKTLVTSQQPLQIDGDNLANSNLFSDPGLDIENIDEEFEKLLSESYTK